MQKDEKGLNNITDLFLQKDLGLIIDVLLAYHKNGFNELHWNPKDDNVIVTKNYFYFE